MGVTVLKYQAPYGAGTTLAMGPRSGRAGAGIFSFLQMTKSPLLLGIGASMAICAVPFLFIKDPESCGPEYQAAQRAYMRYHNMNPIEGVSSKKARAADGH
mmetsp:Transcript_33420/g.48383  ORF Transcript_33420/g.48383 Transcript_33420/m.48383 type:complete len:101 (-) Transcript_33420:261-563(-)|eukprot:CAMPEP_0116024916 /NCGR_PEP_ID=MMETSP0321-20121206/12667_1 /TAXON_ID=163516 /ORGANISM="Leptocylindrus danicus var. danicus, Strain B650" /LENGTH=100 /DNA_ID=CAMNT_0003496869 /DNA_START=14 /DNA_END=316 /DNA_ORIENTATION=-